MSGAILNLGVFTQNPSTELIPSGTVLSGSNLAFYLNADDYHNGDEYWIDRINGTRLTASNLYKSQSLGQNIVYFNGSSSYASISSALITPAKMTKLDDALTVMVEFWIDKDEMTGGVSDENNIVSGSLIHFGSGSNNYSYVADKIYTVPTSTWSTRFSGDRIDPNGVFISSSCGSNTGCLAYHIPSVLSSYGETWDTTKSMNVGGMILNSGSARSIWAKVQGPSGSEAYRYDTPFTDYTSTTGTAPFTGSNVSLGQTEQFIAVGGAFNQDSGSVDGNYYKGGIRKILIYNTSFASGSGDPIVGSETLELVTNIMN